MLKLIVIPSYNSIIRGCAGFYIFIFTYVVDPLWGYCVLWLFTFLYAPYISILLHVDPKLLKLKFYRWFYNTLYMFSTEFPTSSAC
jgi:hypothetical protein